MEEFFELVAEDWVNLRPKETKAVWLLANTLFSTSEDIGVIGRKINRVIDTHLVL